MDNYAYYVVTINVRVPDTGGTHNAVLTFNYIGGETAGAALARATRTVPAMWAIIDSSAKLAKP